ncbi:MAG: tetrahydromethanopterin S-methyltransferase subunit H [Candidatus Thorarchaeota archaeon]
MFVFKREQTVFDAGGVRIGGQPGENPTVLVGGLFFKGQPIVEDVSSGRFDQALAAEWISTAMGMSQRTGHPLILQVYGATPEAMERHLQWVTEKFDGPFMFESTNSDARKRGITYCSEVGLENRTIYNSVNMSMRDDERETLRNSPIHMAVILGWSPRIVSMLDRMELIRSTLSEAEGLGIDVFLVDPAVMPVGAGYGSEYRTLISIKAELGLPTCLGPHNAVSSWSYLRQHSSDNRDMYLASIAASVAAAQVCAADCIMFGSLQWAREIFASVALVQNAIVTAVGEADETLGLKRDLFEPPTCR